MHNSIGKSLEMNKIAEVICYSYIGSRENYEDNFLINGYYLTSDEQKHVSNTGFYFDCDNSVSGVNIFAISDGMGGHNAGEIASRICIEKLAEAGNKLEQYTSFKNIVAHLQVAIANINDLVYSYSCKKNELKGMGATLVLFVTCGTDCAILNIGDSRAYYFTGDSLIQITKDHTEGQRLLDLGLLTRKELAFFPDRKNLNRYIGYGPTGYILQGDEYYPDIKDGLILLCSDGISDFITNERIQEILCLEKNFKIAGKRIINEAATAPDADNATLMLIQLKR